jgi:Uma2 family endonuclease
MATVASPPEQHVVIRVAWDTYERILADHLDSSAPRFTYDRGLLEIMTPSSGHERTNRTLALLVEVVAAELGVDVLNVGSMTFRREDLQRGVEPDTCFYIQHEAVVRHRAQIDPVTDPPPDLVIEIDVTSPSLNKLSIFAQMGIPEIWRANDERIIIFTLEAGTYIEAGGSRALPIVTADALSRFVRESRVLPRTGWLRSLREWLRAQPHG